MTHDFQDWPLVSGTLPTLPLPPFPQSIAPAVNPQPNCVGSVLVWVRVLTPPRCPGVGA